MNKITQFLIINGLIAGAVFSVMGISATQVSAANCTPNASKQCISNIVYWYDSCGAVQTVYQNCNSINQICQNAQCVNKPGSTTTTAGGNVVLHDVKSCYQGNLHWFSSNGSVSDMYASCADTNACTADNCAGNQCVNQLKCDGSTCAQGTADYTTYCGGNNTTQTTTTTTQITGNQTQVQNQELSILLFAIKGTGLSLARNMSVVNGDKVTFLVMVKNNSLAPIDNVLVTADTTSNISYTGNLTIDNLASAGNITTGIDLGTITAKNSKVISFTGTVQSPLSQGVFQINSSINSGSIAYDSDYVIANITNKTAITNTDENSFFGAISKNWYIWLIIIIVLIVIFIIIFRKLSSNA